MWLDVVDLRDFYASPLGATAQRIVGQRLAAMWPDIQGTTILGMGFATPYLDHFREGGANVMAAMPASQGVLHWPENGTGLTLLTDEAELPYADLSIDRVLLVHAVECTESIRPMMREIWRVLAGSGKLIVVVPNRTGIWARLDRTPFGYGRPYTGSQLSRLLRDTMFTPIRTETALHTPPSRSRMMLSTASAWENIGSRWFRAIGGLIMLEATKQIYAATPTVERARRRGYVTVSNR